MFQDNIPFLTGVAASEQSSKEAEPQRNAFPTILQRVQIHQEAFQINLYNVRFNGISYL